MALPPKLNATPKIIPSRRGHSDNDSTHLFYSMKACNTLLRTACYSLLLTFSFFAWIELLKTKHKHLNILLLKCYGDKTVTVLFSSDVLFQIFFKTLRARLCMAMILMVRYYTAKTKVVKTHYKRWFNLHHIAHYLQWLNSTPYVGIYPLSLRVKSHHCSGFYTHCTINYNFYSKP